MTSAAHALAELLQDHRDPKAATRWLQQHHPDTFHEDLQCVRRTWRKTYGDSVVKNSSRYKAGMDEVVKRAEQMARGAASCEERAWAERIRERVIGFDELSFSSQYNLKSSGRLEQTAARSYTGSVAVDHMLVDLVQVPEYAKLHAKLPDPPAGTPVAKTPPAQEGGDVATKPATTRCLEKQGGGCVGEKLNATARALIDDMLATLNYPRPKVFELVCALAFMCGRSLAELIATGQFSAAERDSERAPYRWILFQADSTSRKEVILLLCESHSFLRGLQRLRSMKQVASAASCKNINSRFCKSANTAAKTVLGVDSGSFSDVRALYAGLTLALYGSASSTRKPMDEWARRCIPISNLPSSAKFLASCSAAYADALLHAPLTVRPVTADITAAESEEKKSEQVEAPAGDSCGACRESPCDASVPCE
jgi:hypothetical protein